MTDCNLCSGKCIKHQKDKNFPSIWQEDLSCFKPIKPLKVKVSQLAWLHPQGLYDVFNKFKIKANLYT